MKTIFLILLGCLLLGCNNNKVNNNVEIINNGIDRRLLNIVDSLALCPDVQNFVTFWFTSDTVRKPIINVIGLLIPAPPKPPLPYRQILISETDWFVGYKYYKDWCLVFIANDKLNNHTFEFVEKDSLKRDETPFMENNVYEYNLKYNKCNRIDIVLCISDNDSLILLDRTNDNVFRR